jgi:hypothetical protein
MPKGSEKYFPLIEQYLSSGLSVKQFCEQQNIRQHTFWYWRKKHRQQTQNPSNGFAPLHIEQPQSEGAVSISYPDGTRIVFERKHPVNCIFSK